MLLMIQRRTELLKEFLEQTNIPFDRKCDQVKNKLLRQVGGKLEQIGCKMCGT